MGKSNLIRNSILILSALLAWQAIKDHRLKTARETRNDRYAMMDELWTDEQIEHVKESMRNVGKFLATDSEKHLQTQNARKNDARWLK